MIDKPDIYDITFDTYLGAGLTPSPALSASVIKTMLNKSPKHAAAEHPDLGGAKEEQETKASGIGTVAHAIIMKQNDKRIAVSPFHEFRTAEAKSWRDAALKDGKIVVKEDDYKAAVKMADAFRPTMSQFTKELGESFPEEQFEKTVIVEIDGVWCKIRIDALGKSIWDLKSTGAEYNPQKWVKNQLFSLGYDITVAFYKRVWSALTGEDKQFILAVLEQNEPFDAYPVIVKDQSLEKAEQQIDWALKTWRTGLQTGKWQGYACGRVVWAEIPPWEQAAWEDRKALEEMAQQLTEKENA